VCPDFDLCDACEQKGEHNHPMLKMRQPAPMRGGGRGRHHAWMRHRADMLSGQAGPWRCGSGGGPFVRAFATHCKRADRASSAASSAASSFLSDVTLPDGAEIPVGAEMVKTWKFKNDGRNAWPEGTKLVLKRTKGEFETAPLPIARLPEGGEEVEVSATLKALQPGRGRVCYRLVDNNGTPFGKAWAEVVAVSREEVKEAAKVEPVKTETKPEPAKVEPQIEPKTEWEYRPHRHEVALTALVKMGFEDRKRNIRILNKEKGNLERTVARLLDEA